MIIDLNSVEETTDHKQYDVCICGTGPAGITIARALANQGKRVALFEGGGQEYSEISQNLYDGKSVGVQYWDSVRTARLRFFGGTSNHWAGRCATFDEVDFEQREYFGLPGWPISRAEVFQYFDAACSILDISSEALQVPQNPKWKGDNFRFSVSTQSPPTRFGSKYYTELNTSSRIDVYLNANLADIKLGSSLDTVTSFELRNYSNKKFHFMATKFVLALGAIENARLLLNCDKQIQKGIGNQNDMVGRCFMEHFNVGLGRFVTDDSPIWHRGGLELNPSEAMIRAKKVGNAVLSFDTNTTPTSYGRLKVLKQTLREGVCKSATLTDLSRKLVDFDCPGDGTISSMIEQAPNLNSRVLLGSEQDMFGLRRVQLDWKVNAEDNRTIRILGMELAKEMARTGLARVQLADFILDESMDISDYGAHAHQMGTTRMSEDPKFGVVDKNLRVHGFKNIYVAGSSVFSTGGGTNPTLTVVMLSERLGHHLVRD